ncbi:hypothetical protein GPU89_33155 [Burkholderia cepacia]|nr:hypothetical protein [Burkholderia cepacia]
MQDAMNLGFESADVALISPCLLFEWAMEFDEGTEIFDFYRRAREALGDRLTHYNTGDGRWKPINKRAESLVKTWCENPVPFPKKFYCLMENGADAGRRPAACESTSPIVRMSNRRLTNSSNGVRPSGGRSRCTRSSI